MDKEIAKNIRDGKIFDVAYSDSTKEGYKILFKIFPEKKYYNSIEEEKIYSIWQDELSDKYYALTSEQHDSAKLQNCKLVWLK